MMQFPPSPPLSLGYDDELVLVLVLVIVMVLLLLESPGENK